MPNAGMCGNSNKEWLNIAAFVYSVDWQSKSEQSTIITKFYNHKLKYKPTAYWQALNPQNSVVQQQLWQCVILVLSYIHVYIDANAYICIYKEIRNA